MKLKYVLILAVSFWFISDGRTQTTPRAAPAGSTAPMDPSKMLKLFLDAETTGLPGRVEVTVASVDERLRLAPCANMTPFMPAGARLWGRSMLGVRCQSPVNGGPGWSVLVPVEVRVYAQALVAARPLLAGETPGLDSLVLQEVELTREPPGALTDPAQVGDAILARMLAAGQTLRREHLRPRPIIVVGEMVQLVANGNGFSVSSYGKALSAGADGQMVRVQADSGRAMSGIARPGKIVEIRL